jgi:hypothetical protein
MKKILSILAVTALVLTAFSVVNAEELEFGGSNLAETEEVQFGGSNLEEVSEETEVEFGGSDLGGSEEEVSDSEDSGLEFGGSDLEGDSSEEVVEEEPTNNGGSTSGSRARGGNGGSSNVPTTPSVLGATTGPNGETLACAPYLTTFMKMGMKNDVTEVKKLQTFLNEFNNAGLPVTGNFLELTDKAVRDLQAKYASNILTPWDKAGITTNLQPTGYVYKMTQWFVNSKKCPEAQTALPVLN